MYFQNNIDITYLTPILTDVSEGFPEKLRTSSNSKIPKILVSIIGHWVEVSDNILIIIYRQITKATLNYFRWHYTCHQLLTLKTSLVLCCDIWISFVSLSCFLYFILYPTISVGFNYFIKTLLAVAVNEVFSYLVMFIVGSAVTAVEVGGFILLQNYDTFLILST